MDGRTAAWLVDVVDGEESTYREEPADAEKPADAELDVSGYVRRARRLADLSQRDLAAAVGVGQPRISHIENGGRVELRSFIRILAAAGLRILIVDDAGAEVPPMPPDVLRDRAGRRQPAHLDVCAPPDLPSGRLLLRKRDPAERGAWHLRRPERDRRRRESGLSAADDQPTVSSRREAVRAMRAARARERHRLAGGFRSHTDHADHTHYAHHADHTDDADHTDRSRVPRPRHPPDDGGGRRVRRDSG